jgi:hypothetical protein
MTLLRALLCLLTCLMTLTGLGAAMARGQMAANGVICGTETYTVILAADGLPLFDSGGAPVEAEALPCLDCVFGQIALLPQNTRPNPVTSAASDLAKPLPRISPPASGAWVAWGAARPSRPDDPTPSKTSQDRWRETCP